MPPKVIIWPETKAEFDRMVEINKEKYLPLLRALQLHELVGLQLAEEVAFEEFKEAAAKEDIRRGARPPGTQLGNR